MKNKIEEEVRSVVRIWTDGSTTPENPGPGGWAALLRDEEHERVISGSTLWASNIRMELLAVLRALQLLEKPSHVLIYTDSQYIIDGFRNIQHRDKMLKSHYDIWGLIIHYNQIHQIRLNKVKAHSGEEGNELVDKAAKKAARGQPGDVFITDSEKMMEELRVSQKRRRDKSPWKYPRRN